MIYLDNAATTFPKPVEVYDRTFEWMRESGGNPGRGGHALSTASGQITETTRKRLSDFFGVSDPRRIIFTYNCTDSMNMVIKGLLHHSGHVVTTNLDHNSVSRPLEDLRRKIGLQITRVPFDENGFVDPTQFESAIEESTTLLVVNHGSNVLGSVQSLEPFFRIAATKNIPLLVDAAQTAGRIPIAVGDAPVFLACSGHKGLFAMPGIGVLVVPATFSIERWREGGTGTASEELHHPDELPMRLEAGTPNFLGIASVLFGLEYIQKEGMSRIHDAERELAKRLHRALSDDSRFTLYSTDAGERTSVVSFNLNAAPAEEVATILDQHFGIAVRSGLHCAAVLHQQLGTIPGGCARVSPGYLNTPDHIDTLIAALKSIADGY